MNGAADINFHTSNFVDFLGPIQEEFNSAMLGTYIGSGKYRHVYELPSDPDNFVIKIEKPDPDRQFCNINEWRIWQSVQAPQYAAARRWLAPCKYISKHGSILIQARTHPIKKPPAKVPDFLVDCHENNFGRYKGRVVCHDYGFISEALKKATKRFRLVNNSRMKSFYERQKENDA